VSIDDIKARNYNLDIKNPHVSESINHDPAELLKNMPSSSRKSPSCAINLRAF